MTDAESITREGRSAHADALSGDFRALDRLLALPRAPASSHARAWRLALEAARWHADPSGPLPTLADVEALSDPAAEAKEPLALACSHAARAAWLGLDADALAAWVELGSRVVDRADARSVVRHALDRALLALARGEHEPVTDGAEQLAARASDLADPVLVIEAAAIRGWAAAMGDRLDDALSAARRASRMARTEGLPQPEYLANLVLARIRRLTGRPHLSARILDGLLRVAPSTWWGALTFELVLAGAQKRAGEVDLSASLDGPYPAAAMAAASLREGLSAATAGQRDVFDGARETVAVTVGGFMPHARDVASLFVAVDATRDPRDAPAIARWCEGSDAAVPPALRGLASDLGGAAADEATAAFVHATPGGAARRFLGAGVQLLQPAATLHAMRGRPGRSETMICALALAGPAGLSLDALFRTIYGFGYVHENHDNLFKVLVHRVRAELAGVGEVTRDSDTFALVVSRPLVVPDPRCTQMLEDLMLRLFARRGGGTAKGAAAELNVPLRTAQLALKQLVDEGAVIVSRKGRSVSYTVEDTTFSEPTTAH